MFAVQGVYDGKTIKVNETIPVKEEYDVIITFLHPQKTTPVRDGGDQNIQERLAIVESLFGILPSTVRDDEIKEERLKRYESNN